MKRKYEFPSRSHYQIYRNELREKWLRRICIVLIIALVCFMLYKAFEDADFIL